MKLKFIEEKSEIREFKTGDWVYDTIQPFSIGAIYLVIENKRLARLTTGFVSEKSYYKYTDSDFRLLTDAELAMFNLKRV
jgi:hypothetical protein